MRKKYVGQKIRVVTAEVRRDDQYLITQRLQKSTLPGLWEFPGGKVPEDQQPEQVLRRLLKEKLGLDAEIGELVMEVVHEYDHYTVDMQVYRCDLPEGCAIRCLGVADAAWVAPSEFSNYEFPSADEETISQLLDIDIIDDMDVN